MSYNDEKEPKDDKELLQKLRKRIETDIKAINQIHKDATEMQYILSLGKHFSSEEDYIERNDQQKDKVILPVLNQYCNKVYGEMTKFKMFPKASRSDRKGCEAVSKVIEGHIREILYNSKAEEVLDQAAKNIIEAGIGCISVDLVQSEQNKFGVEVKIKSEPNFQAVIPDAMSQERDWSDGQHVTRFFYKTKEEFKNEYSDIEIPTSDEFENLEEQN